MVPNYLSDDERNERLSELRIKPGVLSELAQPSNLTFLASGIGGR